MNTTLTTIATQTLNRIEEGRQLKARCGLEDDTLRVSIVGYHGTMGVDATVRNGDGNYEVFVSEQVTSCSCKDFEHRQQPCKHCAALCFYLLGTTAPESKQPFALGDCVQLRGLPQRHGKVVCVSGATISVSWPAQGCKLASSRAHQAVELEAATAMPEPLSQGAIVRHRSLGELGKVVETSNGTALVLWDHGYALRHGMGQLVAA